MIPLCEVCSRPLHSEGHKVRRVEHVDISVDPDNKSSSGGTWTLTYTCSEEEEEQ